MKIIHLLTLLVELIIGAFGITDGNTQQKPFVSEVYESAASYESSTQIAPYLSFTGIVGESKELTGVPSEVDKKAYIQVVKVVSNNQELRNYMKLILSGKPWNLS